MRKIVITGVIALLLLFVVVVPSSAQGPLQNLTQNIANIIGNATANATANATTNNTTKAAGPTSFLKAQGNATAPPVPGFEFIFAIAGLLCVAFLLLRRRR